MRPCEAEGYYRAKITEYGLDSSPKSKAVMVLFKAELLQRLEQNPEGEPEWTVFTRGNELECEGGVCIVLRSGEVNQPGRESLINHAGWDGMVRSIYKQKWQPINCSVTVKQEEYQGETRFKISFLNSWNYIPRSGKGRMTKQQMEELEAKYPEFAHAVTPPPAYEETEYHSLPVGDPDTDIPF